eukprot:6213316-Pleurochrysis_carterae.AAC.1
MAMRALAQTNYVQTTRWTRRMPRTVARCSTTLSSCLHARMHASRSAQSLRRWICPMRVRYQCACHCRRRASHNLSTKRNPFLSKQRAFDRRSLQRRFMHPYTQTLLATLAHAVSGECMRKSVGQYVAA